LVAAALPKLKTSDFVTIHATVSNNNVQALGYTHSHLLNAGHSLGQALSLSSDDRVCFAIGLAQFPAQALVWGCIGNRSVIVVPSVSLDLQVDSVLQTVATEKCTTLVIDPSGLGQVISAVREHSKKYDLSSLKRLVIPSSAVDSSLSRSATELLGVQSIWSIDFSNGTVFNELQGKGALLPNLESKIVDGRLAVKGFVVPQTITGTNPADASGFLLTQQKLSKDSSGQFVRA
jgi:acyl-coenzyme A synthetase/AMP-(fatty) acid ligase